MQEIKAGARAKALAPDALTVLAKLCELQRDQPSHEDTTKGAPNSENSERQRDELRHRDTIKEARNSERQRDGFRHRDTTLGERAHNAEAPCVVMHACTYVCGR